MDATFDHPHNHPMLESYARKRSPALLKEMRKEFSIILGVAALKSITHTIHAKSNCNLLVFGVGNDSGLWLAANRDGARTVFLEDHEEWMNTVRERFPTIDARVVNYGTQRKDWKNLLETPAQLAMELEADITETNWDVIIVDAPMSYRGSHPGRMKSIYMARQLATEGTHVFVDDCYRRVEAAYANRFFGDAQLVEKLGLLKGVRHYRVP